MAQFRGVMQGRKGSTSRLGTKKSGLSAMINGWNTGVEVRIDHEGGEDITRVYLTGGSNGSIATRNLILASTAKNVAFNQDFIDSIKGRVTKECRAQVKSKEEPVESKAVMQITHDSIKIQ